MGRLVNCFAFQNQSVISLIGSGGKTTLMWYLAHCFREESILVSTTTKIAYPKQSFYDYFYDKQFTEIGMAGRGITLAGVRIGNGKKLSAPPEAIKQTFFRFDKVFLEADGSKQLPLKGWENFEPVVIPETTITIGVIPIAVLGKTINQELVHRLPLFLKATGTAQGERVQEKTLAAIISSPNGLWMKSYGQKILCINQVETTTQLIQAQKVVELLPVNIVNQLTKIIACSAQSGEGEILWEK